MAIDGSETGNIERQSLGDPLSAQRNPLKQHGSNVVDRSFKQTATPVGTPENILGTLLEAAGHVGTAAGTYMQKVVEEDVTKQRLLAASNALTPSDDATVAGYRAFGVVTQDNVVNTSTAELINEAKTFEGTQDEWNSKVAARQTSDHEALLTRFPQLSKDPLALQSLSNMYGEKIHTITANFIASKLDREHVNRIQAFEEHVGSNNAPISDLLETAKTLGLKGKEGMTAIANRAVAAAETGDLTRMNELEAHMGARGLTPALQKAKLAGQQVFWKNHQEDIANYRSTLEEAILNGEFTYEQSLAEMGHANKLFGNQAYTDTQMTAVWKAAHPDKDPNLLHAGEDAEARIKHEKWLVDHPNAKLHEFTQPGQDANVKANRQVFSSAWLESTWEKAHKKKEVDTTVSKARFAFWEPDKSDRAPLGQMGYSAEVNNEIIKGVKKDRDAGIEKMVAKGTPRAQATATAEVAYIRHLSKEKLQDPEYVRILSSLKNSDLGDSKNMKKLPDHIEKAYALYEMMDEGAKAIHMPTSEERSMYENFKSFADAGMSRVAAHEKALTLSRSHVVITPEQTKAIAKAGSNFAGKFSSVLNWLPGTGSNAPSWYRSVLNGEAHNGILAEIKSGTLDVDRAEKMYLDTFQNTHTQLKDGKFLRGTLHEITRAMKVAPEDISPVISSYLEKHKQEFEDHSNVPITEMYIETNPQRGTFRVKNSVNGIVQGDTPMSTLRTGYVPVPFGTKAKKFLKSIISSGDDN